MKWWAHVLGSAALALALAPREVAAAPLLVAVGAILPDVVEKLVGAKHRSLHELALYLAFAAPLALAGSTSLALGMIDHVLTDALTAHGVTVFGFRVRGPLNTNDHFHNLLAVALHLVSALLLA